MNEPTENTMLLRSIARSLKDLAYKTNASGAYRDAIEQTTYEMQDANDEIHRCASRFNESQANGLNSADSRSRAQAFGEAIRTINDLQATLDEWSLITRTTMKVTK